MNKSWVSMGIRAATGTHTWTGRLTRMTGPTTKINYGKNQVTTRWHLHQEFPTLDIPHCYPVFWCNWQRHWTKTINSSGRPGGDERESPVKCATRNPTFGLFPTSSHMGNVMWRQPGKNLPSAVHFKHCEAYYYAITARPLFTRSLLSYSDPK